MLSGGNIEQLLASHMNLNSSNQLLDDILNNLQGLTPDQQQIREEIKEKTDHMQESWKEVTRNGEEQASPFDMTPQESARNFAEAKSKNGPLSSTAAVISENIQQNLNQNESDLDTMTKPLFRITPKYNDTRNLTVSY